MEKQKNARIKRIQVYHTFLNHCCVFPLALFVCALFTGLYQAEKEAFEKELRERNEAEIKQMEEEHEEMLRKEREKSEERLKVLINTTLKSL
jgi:TRAP-type C4-dicarboxylate transport system substrate-binding protein